MKRFLVVLAVLIAVLFFWRGLEGEVLPTLQAVRDYVPGAFPR